jgi:hypothetical protein
MPLTKSTMEYINLLLSWLMHESPDTAKKTQLLTQQDMTRRQAWQITFEARRVAESIRRQLIEVALEANKDFFEKPL